jgi:hypothetical protein
LLLVSALLLAGCSTASNLWQGVNPLAAKQPQPAITPAAEFVDAEGRCGGAGEAALTGAGIALDMSECEVVRRAGIPSRVDISRNERGERVTTLTYLTGPQPGIYRFIVGFLVSIERPPEIGERPTAVQKKKPRR